MAQPLQSTNLIAPGFKGVNTEDSPIAQDQSFADVADNCVIDKRGRIASRKGIALLTTNAGDLTAGHLTNVHHFYNDAGVDKVISTGNNKIFTGDATLTSFTNPYTISANDWKIVNFNEKAYLFQRDYDPLVYDGTTLSTFSSVNSNTTAGTLKCHEAIGAYGRLWIAGSSSNNQTVFFSDLLIGNDFSGGSSGSITVSKVWPDGHDEIVGLAAHNGSLIIFGRHSILVYANAVIPSTMALADSIAGVGCVDRNSIQHIGTDVLFMSDDGLRSLGRVVQEKSMPISDLSLNVKTEIIDSLDKETEPLQSVYSPENSFYLLTFPSQSLTYCFDLKGRLENNAYRVTKWPNTTFKSYGRKQDGTLLIGTADGIGSHSGYQDNNQPYRMRYYSPSLTFGDPSKLKMVKKLRPTLVGGSSSNVSLKWSYDFSETYNSQLISLGAQTPAYYNSGEFNIAEFSGGKQTTRKAVNANGFGSVVTIGLEADVSGEAISIQEINVLSLIGKTL